VTQKARSSLRRLRLPSTTTCVAIGLLGSTRALAQSSTPVPGAALVHVDCATPRLDGRALFESLGLELQAQGISLIPLDALKSDDHYILEVRTDCETRQQLVLRAARGVRSVEETFSLADVPRSSEPRTVALALAELLEDFRRNRSRGDATTEPDRAPDESDQSAPAGMAAVGPSLDLGPEVDNAFREPPVPLVQDKPVEPTEPPGVHVLAMFGFEQRTFRLSTSLVGLNAGFSLEQAELGASLLRGTVQTSPTSDVTVVVGNLALGYRVADVTNGRWTASVTPRVGIGNLVTTAGPDGTEAEEEGASEIYGDVAVRISVNARLWSRLGVTLHSEAGYGGGVIPIVDGPSTHDHTGLFLGVALNGSLDFSSRKASKLWPPVSAKE